MSTLRGKGVEVSWKLNIRIAFLMSMNLYCTFYSQIPQSMPEAPLIKISIMAFKWFYFTSLPSYCLSCDFQTLQELIICCFIMVCGKFVCLTS